MRGNSRCTRYRVCALIVGIALAAPTACSAGHPTPGRVDPPAQPNTASTTLSTKAAPVSPRATGPTVAPPSAGNINEKVPSGTASILRAVPLQSAVSYRKVKISASISRVARRTAQAHIPGEIAGPALSFQLAVTNTGSVAVALTSLVAVTAEGAKGVPLSPLTTATSAVSGTLQPGHEVAGTYVFHLPTGFRNPVTIQVTYAATAEVARFVGSVS